MLYSFCAQGLPDLLRLWYHESQRVFADRLVNEDDRTWFSALLRDKMKSDFKTDFEQVVTQEPLLYADFMSTGGGEHRPYVEITDHAKVCYICLQSQVIVVIIATVLFIVVDNVYNLYDSAIIFS